jgi:predicted RNA-binding Zn-ribbon protein involved in translation (DUF1610 family)
VLFALIVDIAHVSRGGRIMVYKHFKCPICGKVHTAGEWNSSTLAICPASHKSMYKKIQFSLKENRAYKCPDCGKVMHIRFIIPMLETEVENDESI